MKRREKKLKIVSASAVAVETVLKPYVRHSHLLYLEGSKQLYGGIDDFCETVKKESKYFGWFFKTVKKINRTVQSFTHFLIKVRYQDQNKSLTVIEAGLNKAQSEYEALLIAENSEVLKSWVFCSENRKLLKEIIMFAKVHTEELRDLPYHKLLQYFLAFSEMQKVAREQLWKVKKVEMNENLRFGVEMLNKFSKYSVGVYGKLLVRVLIQKKWYKLFLSEDDEKILKSYTATKDEDLVYCCLESGKYMPAHAILMNHEEKAIILAIRGSMSVFDWLTDLTGDYTTYDYTDPFTSEVLSTGLVHRGILISAQNLSSSLKPKILSLQSTYPNYSTVILGHSLGGGAAALLSLLWMSDPVLMKSGFISLAYAPPAVLSSDLNNHLKNFLFSCSFGNDIVPRMSFGALRDCIEICTFFQEKEKEKVRAAHIFARKVLKGKLSDQVTLSMYEELKNRFNNVKLETPGNVLQIYKGKKHKDAKLIKESEEKYVGSFVEGDFFDEIVFAKSMFNDHFPDLYEKGLKYLAKSLIIN
jgi:hypothetical protein